jgi:hypothetical protein
LLWFDVSAITVRHLTLPSSKICCLAKGVKIFATMESHFFDHMKIFLVQFSYHWWCTIDESKEMAVFYCVECKHSFFGCSMFTLVGYSFFGKIRRYSFTATFSFRSNCVFSFLCFAVYRNDLHASLKTVICKWSTALFPLVELPLKTGTLLLNSQYKDTFLGILMIFLPLTICLYLNVLVLTHHNRTTL